MGCLPQSEWLVLQMSQLHQSEWRAEVCHIDCRLRSPFWRYGNVQHITSRPLSFLQDGAQVIVGITRCNMSYRLPTSESILEKWEWLSLSFLQDGLFATVGMTSVADGLFATVGMTGYSMSLRTLLQRLFEERECVFVQGYRSHSSKMDCLPQSEWLAEVCHTDRFFGEYFGGMIMCNILQADRYHSSQ